MAGWPLVAVGVTVCAGQVLVGVLGRAKGRGAGGLDMLMQRDLCNCRDSEFIAVTLHGHEATFC
jgi:hypothetical protein